ncbi:MAG: pyridoxal phosphate-dependent aminotransferase [Myxococcales bacterium]|nr:pyridoxal phosphate-dependent aminotransferase [Myxococcales bacterium]
MFSKRTNWDFAENNWSRLVTECKTNRKDYIDLTLSNPTVAGLSYPVESITKALIPPQPMRYRPTPAGLLPARQAVAEFYHERGVAVETDHILLTASTSEAYSHLLRLLCDPGDEVLAPAPCYPLIAYLAQVDAVNVRYYSLTYDGDWTIDWCSLTDGLRPQTKAVVVVSPNNPTGNYLNAVDREKLISFADEHGLAIIVDEVFADYATVEMPRKTRYVRFDNARLCFGLHGLSKAIGLPQLKLSWIRIGGQISLVREAKQRLEMVLDTYLSVASPIQEGVPILLRAGQSIQEQIHKRITYNLAQVSRLSKTGAPWTPLCVQGGWTQPIRLPSILEDEQWACSLLVQDGCCVQPGYFYDFAIPSVIVISLLVDEATFADGLQRLDAAVRLRLS